MRSLVDRLDLCSINTATLGFQAPLPMVIDAVAKAGFGGISPWRREVEGGNVGALARRIRDAGLKTNSYCRSTYLPASSRERFLANIDDNRKAIDDAATLGAQTFFLVVGGLPDGSKDLSAARQQVAEGLSKLLEFARGAGICLALEPLHPVYAADRSCITTLGEALDLCARLEPDPTGAPVLGVGVDVYHTWWDPTLSEQIERAGASRRIVGFHVNDWLLPVRDVLNDRGMMGDGVIDIPKIRRDVEAACFDGFVEVEIFSTDTWWKRPIHETLAKCAERLATHC